MSDQAGSNTPASTEDADRWRSDQAEEMRHRSRQLQLSVAVANAAGFTAASAKVLDALAGSVSSGTGVVAIIFPSAVMFALGMTSVGLSAWLDAINAVVRLQHAELVRLKIAGGAAGKRTIRKWTFVETVGFFGLETLAGALFLAGVGYPLVVLGARYLSAGVFTW